MSQSHILRLLTVLALAIGAPALADELILTSGRTLVGVIEEETDSLVRLRTELGVTGIGREFIAEIHNATPAENANLRAGWAAAAAAEAADKRTRRLKREAAKAAARAFADEQRARGLVEHDGEWMQPLEKQLKVQREGATRTAKHNARVQQLEGELREARALTQAAHRDTTALRDKIAQAERVADERNAEAAALRAALLECAEHRQHLEYQYSHVYQELEACRAHRPPAPAEH